MRTIHWLLLIVVAIGLCVGLRVESQPVPVVIGWEYKLVYLSADKTGYDWQVKLNEYGQQGWELAGFTNWKTMQYAVFKKPSSSQVPVSIPDMRR